MKRFGLWLVKIIFGEIPLEPSAAIWKLIDAENQKPENEIRCDYIDAWVEAAERVKNHQVD